jgi:hypothetical protein
MEEQRNTGNIIEPCMLVILYYYAITATLNPNIFRMQVFRDVTLCWLVNSLLGLLDPEDGGGMFLWNYSN